MDKIDPKKQHKALYTARQGKPVMVDVPEFTFLMADGQGDPGERFAQLCERLYPLAYGLRAVIKKAAEPRDYAVAPLEGLWWADDMKAFAENRREEWQWTLMIMQPPEVDQKMFEQVREEVRKKKKPALIDEIRLESFAEGACCQILHLGPYTDEGPTIAEMHKFIALQGFFPSGKHHEIYLSDPRKTAPEKLKTILRQPVKE